MKTHRDIVIKLEKQRIELRLSQKSGNVALSGVEMWVTRF